MFAHSATVLKSLTGVTTHMPQFVAPLRVETTSDDPADANGRALSGDLATHSLAQRRLDLSAAIDGAIVVTRRRGQRGQGRKR